MENTFEDVAGKIRDIEGGDDVLVCGIAEALQTHKPAPGRGMEERQAIFLESCRRLGYGPERMREVREMLKALIRDRAFCLCTELDEIPL